MLGPRPGARAGGTIQWGVLTLDTGAIILVCVLLFFLLVCVFVCLFVCMYNVCMYVCMYVCCDEASEMA